MNSFPPASPRGHRAFTLVELLSVMAIIAVVSGTATFLISDGRPLNIRSSAAQIGSVVSVARDLAVTSNRRTRFAIVSNAEENDPELQLRSYAILQFEPEGGGFKVATPLKHLPAGVYFERDQEVEASGTGIFEARDEMSVLGRKLEYAYIEFLPTGGTKNPSGANVFSLVAGSEAGEPVMEGGNYARLGVSQHTGRVRVERKE